jgi:hypothetical protein
MRRLQSQTSEKLVFIGLEKRMLKVMGIQSLNFTNIGENRALTRSDALIAVSGIGSGITLGKVRKVTT